MLFSINGVVESYKVTEQDAETINKMYLADYPEDDGECKIEDLWRYDDEYLKDLIENEVTGERPLEAKFDVKSLSILYIMVEDEDYDGYTEKELYDDIMDEYYRSVL